MRREWALVTCGFVALFGIAVMTAEKPSEEYSKAMKSIGAASQNITKAIAADDFDTVEKNTVTIIEAFPPVEKYWTGKADDAMKLVKAAQTAAADLRVVAGLKNPDGVAFSAKELTDTCAACHTAHRERLPDGTFQIK
jgi:cytochrome c556